MDRDQSPQTVTTNTTIEAGVGEKPSQPSEHQAAETANVRKRKRKTLSCVDCKRRKLKCDRIYPACGRCVKGGYPSLCVYTSGVNPGDDQDQSESDDGNPEMTADQSRRSKTPPQRVERESAHSHLLGTTSAVELLRVQDEKIARLENRIAGLEKLVNASSSPSTTTKWIFPSLDPSGIDDLSVKKSKGGPDKELMIFRGKDYRTQYDGRTFAGSLVVKFPELKGSFDTAMRRHPALRRVHGELLSLYKSLPKGYKPKQSSRQGTLDDELLNLLPSSEKIKSSIRLYLSTFETAYRILHVPSFNREFQEYQSSSPVRPEFVAILLLIMATVACCANGDPMKYTGRSSAAREEAVHSIFAVEAWLDRQSRKHMTLPFFQLHCLLLLARRVNSHKVKRTWTCAENVISIAAAAGFHRDPSLVTGKKISLFDQEMKRRLWFTMIELDLLASFEQGMPASALALICDTAPPRNIDDEDFDETTEEMPSSVPLASTLTSTTFLCAAYQSLPLRLRLNNTLNDPKSHLTKAEIMSYTEEITKHIQQVQEFSSLHKISHSHNAAWSNDTSMSLTVLELQLYRFLLHLHRFPADGPQEISSEAFSHHLRSSSATKLIELHHKYWKGGNSVLILSRNDLFDAVVNLCHDIDSNIRAKQSEDSGRSSSSPSFLLATLSSTSSSTPESFFATLETALNMLEDRNTRIGPGTGGSHSYWLTLGIYALVRMRLNPEQERMIEQRILADRVTSSYYRVLSRQVDDVSMNTSRTRISLGEIGGGAGDKELQQQQQQQQQQTQPQVNSSTIPGAPPSGPMAMDWNQQGLGNTTTLPPLSELPEYSAHPPFPAAQTNPPQPSTQSFMTAAAVVDADFNLSNTCDGDLLTPTTTTTTTTTTATDNNMILPWGIWDDFWGDIGGGSGGGGGADAL